MTKLPDLNIALTDIPALPFDELRSLFKYLIGGSLLFKSLPPDALLLLPVTTIKAWVVSLYISEISQNSLFIFSNSLTE